MTDDTMRRMIEAGARARAESQIRNARRYDTPAEKVEAAIAGAVDACWREFVWEVEPVIRAVLPIIGAELDRIAIGAVKVLRDGGASADGQAGATAMGNALRDRLAEMLGEKG